MAALERWTDGRIEDRFKDIERRFDDVDRRLSELGPMPKAVAVLSMEVKSISGKLDELVGNPISEARQAKTTLRVSVIAAVVGSAAVVGFSMLLLGGVHP